MAKSKITTTFEDDFDEEEKLSPEDQAAWDEMEEYFSESLHQFKEGEVIQGTIIELAKGLATVDVGFKSEGTIHLHEFPNNGQDLSVGDQIETGDPICVLEAMKMENHIFAEKSGTIESVSVSEGASVGIGDALVTIG